jgi:GNAT superfamily N-acetyltransferase
VTAVEPVDLDIQLVDLDDPVARELERKLFEELRVRYPDDDLAFVPGAVEHFRPPYGAFLVARVAGHPAGAAALRSLGGGVGELKRLWVDPAYRRRGIARALTTAREQLAREWGWHQLVLETGWAQPEQLSNAAANGYLPVPPWETEWPYDPRVSYLGKTLTPRPRPSTSAHDTVANVGS